MFMCVWSQTNPSDISSIAMSVAEKVGIFFTNRNELELVGKWLKLRKKKHMMHCRT